MSNSRIALALLVVLLAVGGCRPDDSLLLGSRWELIAIESSEAPAVPVPDDLESTLTFHEDGVAIFRAGCTMGVVSNYDFGELENAIGVFRPIGCMNGRDDAGDLEFAFFEFSIAADSHELTEDELIVHSPTDTWRFRRLPTSDLPPIQSALRPGPATPRPTAPPQPTAAGETAAPTADPFQDEATLRVYSQLEEDSTALIEFMHSDPARRAMYGGTHIEHPTGPQLGAPDSYNVLQLVATEAQADALRAQLPPLNFPDRLQIELVTCTEAHLNDLMAQRRPALDAAGIWISQSLDTKANRVALLVKASPDYVVVDGLIDQSTLPPDIAAELDDPCIVVSQGTDTIVAGDDPLDGTKWQLVSVPGYEAIIERLTSDRVPTLAFAEGAFVFTTGCNDPSGYYTVDGDSLITTGVMMHLVNCSGELGQEVMALEQALADATGTFTTYTLIGDELRIGYADGELVWLRLPDEVSAADPLDGTQWQLVAMTGLDDTLALLSNDQLPTLSFQEGGFHFDTGCNNPGGNYVVRGSQIEVSAVRTTTMLCSQKVDDPAPKVESALATIASTLESYSISGDELHLGYPGGELVLTRLP